MAFEFVVAVVPAVVGVVFCVEVVIPVAEPDLGLPEEDLGACPGEPLDAVDEEGDECIRVGAVDPGCEGTGADVCAAFFEEGGGVLGVPVTGRNFT